MKRFLLVQFGHFGDCLYATTLAQQIKYDNLNCHITWAISSKFQSILTMNPHVDAVMIVPYMYSSISLDEAWDRFYKEIKENLAYEYDTILISQLARDNLRYYDGSIRSAILSTYGKKITVPVAPIVVLSNDEIQNVAAFIKRNNIKSFSNIVMFECGPQSGQSSINVEFAEKVSQELVNKFHNTCFLLSSTSKVKNPTLQIIDASQLSFRENAELANYCTLFVGCSSGITWITTSTWTKKINTIQIINPCYEFSTSLAYDAQRFCLPFDHILEINDAEKTSLPIIIEQVFIDGFKVTRARHHRGIEPDVKCMGHVLSKIVIYNGFKSSFFAYCSMIKKNKALVPFKLLCYALKFTFIQYFFILFNFLFPPATSRRKIIRYLKTRFVKKMWRSEF